MYPGKWAARVPQRPAVITAETGAVLTYGELEDRSVRLANVLLQAGLRRGDVVAVLSDNDARVFEVYWAALRSGLWFTAVNHHLSADEVAYILRDSGARAVVVSASQTATASAVTHRLPDILVRLAFGGEVPGYQPYEEAVATASSTPSADQPRGAEMLYSSGTTGRPKGVRQPLPENQQVWEGPVRLAEMCSERLGMGEHTTYLSPAPIYHAAPLRFGAAIHALGGTVVMMLRFDPAATLAAIERYRVTDAQFVPTMFVRMLKLDPDLRVGHDLSSLRTAIHAAAPCPVEVKQSMIDWWGPKLVEYYAATESLGMTLIDSQCWLARPGSVGQAIVGVLHICDDEGNELPAGEAGTVYFERDEIPFEYHNDPAKTAGARHPTHPTWSSVGDIGYLDDEGYLYLTDRKAFTIISGGVNIYPQEVEDVLTLHPKVIDVGVIGVPDHEMGESVKAFVQPAPGAQPGPDLEREIIDFVRSKIAHYKAPRSVAFLDELPRTPTGKLVKGELKKQAG